MAMLDKIQRRISATALGIGVIGDLILGYSKPLETPNLVFVVANSRNWTTFQEWIAFRRIIQFGGVGYGFKRESRVDGVLHSLSSDDTEVACIYTHGFTLWCYNGNPHRDDDKPAQISPNGACCWSQHGIPHRDNKPAMIDSHGNCRWFFHGVEYQPTRILDATAHMTNLVERQYLLKHSIM